MTTSNTALLRLLHLCDPSLPVGGFSHSAGLETYVQQGMVHNMATAKAFIVQQLQYNLFYTDGALASLAYTAGRQINLACLAHYDALCTAVKLPEEIRLASTKLGLRLLKIFENDAMTPLANQYLQNVRSGALTGHYCIAFGILAAEWNVGHQEALAGFYYNALTGFVTNCVKLVPLGQLQGQQLLMESLPLVQEIAERSLYPDEALVGYCCPGFDIASMQHERLYSRLYMS